MIADNAARHAKGGHARVKHITPEETIRIIVSDTGPGIASTLKGEEETASDEEAIQRALNGESTLKQVAGMARLPGHSLIIESKEGYMMLQEEGQPETGTCSPYPGTKIVLNMPAKTAEKDSP